MCLQLLHSRLSIVDLSHTQYKINGSDDDDQFDDDPYVDELSTGSEPELVLVHLGKTAGSTITCMLGPSLNGSGKGDSHCDASDFRPSRIASSVVSRVHLVPAPLEHFDDFLITVRNPVERIISWFYFIHPKYPPKLLPRHIKNCDGYTDMFRCYDTIQALGEVGLATGGDGEPPDSCPDLARDMVAGKRMCWHNTYNYNFTYGPLVHGTKKSGDRRIAIYAIRTEHLEEDWSAIDRILGGGRGESDDDSKNGAALHDAVASPRKNSWNETASFPDKTLSVKGRSNLCRVLCDEIQIYKGLLRLAININEEHENESLEELLHTCPEETREIRECPEVDG